MKYKIWNKTDCSLGLTERGGQGGFIPKAIYTPNNRKRAKW